MKLLNILAVFVCMEVARAINPTTCYNCLENTDGGADPSVSCEKSVECSNTSFPNTGRTHCYTAAASYNEGGAIHTGIARGCIDCTDKAAARTSFKAAFDADRGWLLINSTLNMDCCDNSNDCNDKNVTAFELPSTAPPTTVATTSTAAINPTTCYHCLEVTDGGAEPSASCKTSFACSNSTFPNAGTTHCYTVAASYKQGGATHTGIARGCINCTDPAAARASMKTAFNTYSDWELIDSTLNLKCCDSGDDCNNQTVTALKLPIIVTPITDDTIKCHACCLFPVSGIMAFLAIVLVLFL